MSEPAVSLQELALEYVVRTAREVCELPEPEVSPEILGPLVVLGSRTGLGGYTGEGKTTLIFQMVRAIVRGEEFLGYTGVPGRVLIVDAEQGLRTIKRRLREVGLDSEDGVDILQVPDGLELDRDSAQVAAIEKLLREGGYSLVVFDPLYKLHSGDANDMRAAVNLMRRFDAWRTEFGFALILAMHLRKAPPDGTKMTLHEFFGSGGYTWGAEIILGIRRLRAGYSRLFLLKDRDGDLPIGDAWGLVFNRDDGGFKLDPNVGKPSTADRLRDLRAADPGITQEQAAAALDVTDRTVRKYWGDTEPPIGGGAAPASDVFDQGELDWR